MAGSLAGWGGRARRLSTTRLQTASNWGAPLWGSGVDLTVSERKSARARDHPSSQQKSPMAMAVASTSLHLSLPVRRSSPTLLLTSPRAQIHSQRAFPQGRRWNSIRRVVSKRNLMVRAADNDQGNNEADSRRLEQLEARLGVGRKSRREGGGALEAPPAPRPKAPAKAWDDMSFAEKAWELYVGEKGALFWLNKLAYASIYLIIGGWIVFRFIGPALGWYELDSPLLPPSQVLSGTAGR